MSCKRTSRLYGSTSHCVSQLPKQWETANSTPTSRKSLNEFWWSLIIITISRISPIVENLISIRRRGLSRRIPLLGFFLLSFWLLRRAICKSYDVLSSKDVPLRDAVDTTQQFGFKSPLPKKLPKGSVNRHFQAKFAKCKKRTYIRIYCSDSNQFLQMMKTTKCCA